MAKYGKGIAPKEIARERIGILLREADACKNTDSARAACYVRHARDIATKLRVRLTRAEKRTFCHHCGTYLVPGSTSRVRIARGRVSITCTVCGNVVRIPLTKKTEQ